MREARCLGGRVLLFVMGIGSGVGMEQDGIRVWVVGFGRATEAAPAGSVVAVEVTQTHTSPLCI